MAHRGPAAKANKHGRTPTADWTDVPDQPYQGASPELPPLPRRKKWNPMVAQWWAQVRQMPHCVLWRATDWQFALETALMKDHYWKMFENGETGLTTAAVDIRRREDQLGTTQEALRKLRIRYVDPTALVDEDDVEDLAADDEAVGLTADEAAKVTSIASRRARLTAAG